ncbi:sigma-70 family RNA polymerase sigma factor [Sulfitobacter sp. G21635-S1]|uniref:sigma-70 family RNA polymerase sigma factor n=1 Tax=Sulfitobacter sp. G21635-S1 TaxID=3014043 RepID=UPI0022AE6443|nr:sigma-70 family RNA polymerase sigma factor [Sulfitobacter sp. G21635-S1]MCZ4255022.1 sigma-70 family RNA polymerase sigma factor [Sulfitobacter sp. G21635-S1]
MRGKKFLLDEFEAHRARLNAVAYRMLGSRAEAEDAVQEAWLRLNRSEPDSIANLGGWLTTVVGRLCLDMLRARKSRQEESLDGMLDNTLRPDPSLTATNATPEEELAMADSVGLAMLTVLETLTPGERVAFVLHDVFAVPFDDIAGIVGRSPDATRQLASRARRRVQGAQTADRVDNARRREVVDAFLAAARGGDFDALMTMLDPDVVLRGDSVAVKLGGHAELRGAPAVAAFFKGSAQAARPALVDNVMDVAVVPGGQLLLLLRLDIAGDRITGMNVIAEPEDMAAFDLSIVED